MGGLQHPLAPWTTEATLARHTTPCPRPSRPTPPPGPTHTTTIPLSSRSWPLHSYLELGLRRTAPSRARGHTRLVLAEWGLSDLSERAEQVVSELVTNAVTASEQLIGSRFGGRWSPGAPPVRLWLLSDHSTALVEVWDGSDQMPEPQDIDPEGENGRGLWLVEALSEDWGAFRPAHASGKVTWAVLTMNGSADNMGRTAVG